jgi:hypothetical protein
MPRLFRAINPIVRTFPSSSKSLFIRNMATGRAIKCAQTGGVEVMKVESNVAFPAPKGTQVLIKAAYSGVNL